MTSDPKAISLETDRVSRVLMLLPTIRDEQITSQYLTRAGLENVACKSSSDLAAQIVLGAGAVLVTEEFIVRAGIDHLLNALNAQPDWSDLPVILMMSGGVQTTVAARVLQSMRNVTLLERPPPRDR